MIRINLLDSSKKKQRKLAVPSGAPVLLIYILLLGLEILLLLYWAEVKDQALQTQQGMTKDATAKVEAIAKEKKEKEELKKLMDAEETKAKIFDTLRNGQVGPGNLMAYLAYSMSTPPLSALDERQTHEQVGWNPQWNPDNAWLTKIEEDKENRILISGKAISHDDFNEVFKRFSACIYLQDIRLDEAGFKKTSRGRDKGAEVLEFEIDAQLNYDPEVGKKAPEAPAEAKPEEKKDAKADAAKGK